MTIRTHAGLLCVVLAAGLASCEGGSPFPMAPSTAQPQQPPGSAGRGPETAVANVILSGVVYEVTPMGRVPIEGVQVMSDYFHAFPSPTVVTDAQGSFSFRPVWVCPCAFAPWVEAGVMAIWVDKAGYEAPAGQPASIFGRRLNPDVIPDARLRDVTINGDTRFDIELVRR